MIKSWQHFDRVYTIPCFGKDGVLDWRISEVTLPPSLNFWHLGWKEKFPKLHFGLLVTWEPTAGQEGEAESLVLAPHSIFLDDVKVMREAKPAIKPLVILHTTKETWDPIGRVSNMGAIHGLKVMREAKPKYWVATHDEIVTSTGAYSWFLKDREISFDQALKQEENEKGVVGEIEEFEFAVVENGDSFVLT